MSMRFLFVCLHSATKTNAFQNLHTTVWHKYFYINIIIYHIYMKHFYIYQYFAITLFECAEADHYTPAKSLMNMCFTYYHQQTNRPWMASSSTKPNTNKQYLCSVLRDQPIWRSLRFWNAAFFDAVQAERVTFFESNSRSRGSIKDAQEDWQFQANVTFGQLGTFTYQMHGFGLPKTLCLQFLRKQSTIANLTSGLYPLAMLITYQNYY